MEQVGAHGSGARLPPVEDQIVSMRIATPGMGTLTLSHAAEPDLFSFAKLGLGALGVVTQVRHVYFIFIFYLISSYIYI